MLGSIIFLDYDFLMIFAQVSSPPLGSDRPNFTLICSLPTNKHYRLCIELHLIHI